MQHLSSQNPAPSTILYDLLQWCCSSCRWHVTAADDGSHVQPQVHACQASDIPGEACGSAICPGSGSHGLRRFPAPPESDNLGLSPCPCEAQDVLRRVSNFNRGRGIGRRRERKRAMTYCRHDALLGRNNHLIAQDCAKSEAALPA